MFKLKYFLIVTILLITAGSQDTCAKVRELVYELTTSARPTERFSDLPYGIVVSTNCYTDNSRIYDSSEMPQKLQKKIEKSISFNFKPNVADFFNESFKRYVRNIGLARGANKNSDFYLRAILREYKVVDNVTSAKCIVTIQWELENPSHRMVLDGIAKGRYSMSPGQNIADALDKAYTRALEDICWDEIATELQRTSETIKHADMEQQKQVTGDGDTALEHTIIRWYIISSPAGADVSWRVVSSTPDVKNTNASYIGTTPYETTESFDIRGLKLSNSGNVQIEITCEKPGYLPQRRRFNLRQAIEQREISAKFNLVRDNDSRNDE
ncbi:MAG: hypothetical protein K2L96_06760 [Muribaculaceae bacterium]|nr:hypothetical protein [Muribaculaceae bacterium]